MYHITPYIARELHHINRVSLDNNNAKDSGNYNIMSKLLWSCNIYNSAVINVNI